MNESMGNLLLLKDRALQFNRIELESESCPSLPLPPNLVPQLPCLLNGDDKASLEGWLEGLATS